MTPRQSNILKGLSLSAIGLAFGFGSAWIDTKRDIAEKADKIELERHIVREAGVDSTLLRLVIQQATTFRAYLDAQCVSERNPYKRKQMECRP